MNLLSISGLAKLSRENYLFTDVTFGLNEGDKAALIGRNGTGKSTLLNTIAGVLEPDRGTVVINKEAGVSFLPQNPVYDKEDTIRDHVFKSDSPKLKIIRDYEDICLKLEDSASESIQKKFDELTVRMNAGDLWNYEAQVKSILSTLGINDMDRKMGELSGGMIKKVALAQVLVEDTKLLLLDEPTNHLDISTIWWLQNYLAETKRSVLMVTHDRYFLDAVCNNIYELDRNRVKLYVGNYSTYLEKKETEAEIEANTERRIESVLRFERDWLRRGPCARGTKAKARIQRDMALINREKFQEDKGFTFHVEGRRLGGKVLELHNISKNFAKGFAENKDNHPVLKNFSYTFNKGEKIGIFGDNGSGKTTLLNIITGKTQADEGTVVKGENTFVAYYEQNPVFENTSLTVLEYIKEAADIMKTADGTVLSAGLFLEQFGFEGRIQHSAVSTLSGGERKRLYLVRLLISNPNFIILDEPTNDFDIFTMNILEKFLLDFGGCLLIVSHDRYFMDKVADTMFVLENDGSVSGFVGKCSEYIDYREEKRAAEKDAMKAQAAANKAAEAVGASTNNQTANSSALPQEKKRKMSFKEQKEFEELEKNIAEWEEKKSELETAMADSDYTKAQKAGQEYSELEAKLEAAYSRWEELADLQ
ncbi:MAG: ABC-F family ATP-binding cassette domain-containing protein [Treponema sp.]|uniref:ABC-F family ATP-binding cassette domain-containing protein n=1 Tax=Treponema sp. TaxID=166 RepID=UPI001D7E3AFE|nr:ABC-F family ATP-binding cassette domain-containing protein [Treponema sp.]MBS7240856.1 ABC-F family ATP-binding cassette domain-containing protein [Treponema sp.]